MHHYEKHYPDIIQNTLPEIHRLEGMVDGYIKKGNINIAAELQNEIDRIRSVIKLNKLKADYLRAAAKYVREGNEFVYQTALTLQVKLQNELGKEKFKQFIERAKKAFQRGKVKSKVILTLLKRLDNNPSVMYNPGKLNGSLKDTRDDNKAVKLYEKFHHFKPSKVETVDLKINPDKNGVMHVMKLGTMPEMVYISDKDINDTGSREKISYIHKFRKFLPIYTDGNVFIIPAEKQDITERGLIYNGKKRVMNPPVKRRKK